MEITFWLHLNARGRTGKYRKLKLFRELWWHKQTAPNLADTCLRDILIRAVSESLKSNILSDFFSAGLLAGALLQRASSIYGLYGKRNSGELWRQHLCGIRCGCKDLNSKKRGFDKSGSTEEASEERCVVLNGEIGSKDNSLRIGALGKRELETVAHF